MPQAANWWATTASRFAGNGRAAIFYWLAPDGTALAADEGVAATDASLDAAGPFAAVAVSLARCAAALWPGAPLMPDVLLITPLLAESMVLLLFSSTFLQPAVPHASAATANAADT
jgi:hypothetical protein